MAETKTKLTDASVSDFIKSISDKEIREGCTAVAGLMNAATKAEPRMWGSNIIGFGTCLQKYANGSEAEWMMIAMSPRKKQLTLYLGASCGKHPELMDRLGKYTRGKGCLHIKRLSDVDLPTLNKLIKASVQEKLKAQGK